MSWEDGPDAPEDEEPLQGKEIAPAELAAKAQLTTRIVIEADRWDDQRLSEMILGRVAEMVKERTEAAIRLHVRATVDAVVREVVEARVVGMVDAVLTEGWRKTDGYGSPTGPAITLKDRVSEILQARPNNYSGSVSYLDGKISEEVNKVLTGELGKAIEEAKKKVRDTLDSAVMTKLQQALKEGLGLRT